MKKKKFLIKMSAAIAAFSVTSSFADPLENSNSYQDKDLGLQMVPAVDSDQIVAGHRSHGSHRSHSSHRSGR
jgi:hypothetical protein